MRSKLYFRRNMFYLCIKTDGFHNYTYIKYIYLKPSNHWVNALFCRFCCQFAVMFYESLYFDQ